MSVPEYIYLRPWYVDKCITLYELTHPRADPPACVKEKAMSLISRVRADFSQNSTDDEAVGRKKRIFVAHAARRISCRPIMLTMQQTEGRIKEVLTA